MGPTFRKFRPRRSTVTAVQFTGTNADVVRQLAPEQIEFENGRLVLFGEPTVLIPHPGDWVVLKPSGEVSVYSERGFELVFEEVSE